MSLSPGSRLGPYEVLKPLGSGGMGEVYAARDVDLRRVVALKVLPESVAADPVRLARFEREAQLASSLNHPNIVTIHGIGREGAVSYIAMELIEGQTLQAARAEGAWPLDRVVDTAAQIAGGLAKAHDAGVVHRDLKPQNVMITRDGFAKVLDFGLSTLSPSSDPSEASTMTDAALTTPGAVLGTVHYMSPEQAAGRPADFRTDQFAFGAVLYELLAGRRPFEAPTAVQVLSRIIDAEPPPLAELNPLVPDRLLAVVERCLSKNPDGRYASTHDLVRDLQGAREAATPSRTVVRRPPARARSKAAWIVAALVLTAAAAAAVPGIRSRLPWPFSPPVVARQQIAVLPFASVGSDPANRAFSDGLVEVLTTQLTQITRFEKAIEVVPASDVRTERITTTKEARQAFHVSRVVGGSVQTAGGSTHVTIDFSDAATGFLIKSTSIDLKGPDARVMQDAVVREVAKLIGASLPAELQQSWSAGGTTAAAAYQAYVQGRGHLQRYDRLDAVELAIEAFRRAIAADATYALAHAGLGEAFWRKFELTKDSQWIALARASCATALGLASNLAPVHVTLGVINAGTSQYEEAVKELKRAIALDPIDADAYRELANVYQAQGRYPETEETYKTAIEERPNYWANHGMLGGFYMQRLARYEDAEREMKKVLELRPESPRAHSNLGGLYLAMGRNDGAIREFEESIRIAPTGVGYSNLGTGYFFLGQYAKAAQQMEKAIELGRDDSRLLKNLAAAYSKVPEKKDKAAEAFKRALAAAERELQISPRSTALLLRAAECQAALKQHEAARARIEQALRQAPDDVTIQVAAGEIYETLGDRARAIQLIRQALAHGYSKDLIDKSPDLAALRADPRFTQK